jgi:hypothetical protein
MSVRRVRDALVAALGPDAQAEHRANHTGVGKLSFAVLHLGIRAEGGHEGVPHPTYRHAPSMQGD